MGLLICKFCQFLIEVSTATCLYFSFRMITSVSVNGFTQNWLCALILLRSALGLLMGKFCQFLTRVICQRHICIFILGNNLCKSQWIFTKLDVCEIWLWNGNGQILSVCESYLPTT